MWSISIGVNEVGDEFLPDAISVWVSVRHGDREVLRRSERCDSSEWPSLVCELAHEVAGSFTPFSGGASV